MGRIHRCMSRRTLVLEEKMKSTMKRSRCAVRHSWPLQAAFVAGLFCSLVSAQRPLAMPPVADRLAAIPDLDRQLADIERTLNAASDQGSLSATTARFILEFVKEAEADPKAFDAKPSSMPPRPNGAAAAPTPPGPPNMNAAAGPPSQKHADYIASRGATLNFDAEVRRAATIAADVKAGRDPMAGVKGDLLLAYRSGFDGMLVPYRIFVPATYDKSRKYPLAILLHGANSDENTLMGSGEVQKEAQRRGYIVAAVNGRGPFGNYRKDNGAERDVFDVLALMQKYYNIDERRVFLAGHSMGAMGTWRIGLEYRDRFAALAPSAGTRDTADLDEQLSSGRKIPILLSCGGKDGTTCATHVAVYRKLKAAGYPTKVVEYPDDVHGMVFLSAVPEMFAWFDNF
jgi:acetyl esterase/lipase